MGADRKPPAAGALLAAVGGLLAGLCGCLAPVRPAEPSEAGQGALVLSLSFKGVTLPNFRRHGARAVYFARLDAKGEPDMDHLLVSNYAKGRWVYLLDAPPGRYTPVAASYSFGRSRFLARIPPQLQKELSSTVRPGELSFGGKGILLTDWLGFDTAFFNALKHLAAYLPPFRARTLPVAYQAWRLDRSSKAEAEAMRRSLRDLAGTFWFEAADRRLLAMGNPPEPVMEGLLFARPARRRQEERFSYIDTLGWGDPSRIEGGLEWRRSRGGPAVAVLFLRPGTPGYRPADRYLRDLRSEGSPEDVHAAWSVVVASRTAQATRHTAYHYPEGALLGSAAEILVTETLLVPEAEGFHLIRCKAGRREFEALRPRFRRFIENLVFEPAKREAR